MPELPEVETFRQFAEQYALNRPVRQVRVLTPKILENTTEAQLRQQVETRCLTHTRRVGKHLLIQIEGGGWLFLHFGMTGYLSYAQGSQRIVNAYGNPALPEKHIRVQLEFEDGGLFNFHEQRMFGKLGWTPQADAYFKAKKLGPDALEVEKAPFIAALQKRKGQLKPALMDQSLVAGVGNVYADELLYQCGLHPERLVSGLPAAAMGEVYTQMVAVLRDTVAVQADRDQLPPHYLLHTRKPKGRCPQGNHLLDVKSIGGRTTYFCPICQPFLG
ncbi:Fpg/Nei family DNA glycosylase [Vampirovibrio sp.]|uniref:Fpg/Nei family DNA glycosylase n=1 Tax=Vampirovibrio sp. TaxID=2717857 RepID=UPI0035938B5E